MPGPTDRRPNLIGLLLAALAFVLFLWVGRQVGGWLFSPPAGPGIAPTVVVAPTATPAPTATAVPGVAA